MGYKCPRCSNTNKEYFFTLNGYIYCRKCITYIGDKASHRYVVNNGFYKLKYKLTQEQEKASDFVLANIIDKKNCAVNAVCGAGKTEIIYDSLKYCLNNGLKVGIAIPRKDVVIELQSRIEKDFNVKVIGVYGGNTDILEADIIVFTTHQSFRYVGYFDVLIIDEIDAFPYSKDTVLQQITKQCSKVFVYLSATMPKYIEKDKNISKYYLNKRYHGYKLPIPKCKECISMIMTLKRQLHKYKNKVVLVYFPTIKLQTEVNKKVKCNKLVNSRTTDREKVLEEIKKMKKGVVFTTTILERGITIKDVQVIVYNADHNLFNEDTLIQISGRAGRDKIYHDGNIVFICKSKNKIIKRAINTLKKANE